MGGLTEPLAAYGDNRKVAGEAMLIQLIFCSRDSRPRTILPT
jgi:hypothetical protein